MKHKDSKLQLVLEALRAMADKSTKRTHNGQVVADIVPSWTTGRWSLVREVSESVYRLVR